LLDLVDSLAEVSESAIWEANLPADANWHKINLLVKLPPVGGGGKYHLAFGAIGGMGNWQVSEVIVQPGSLRVLRRPTSPESSRRQKFCRRAGAQRPARCQEHGHWLG